MKEAVQPEDAPLSILSSVLSRLQKGVRVDSNCLWFGKSPDDLSRVQPDSDVEKTATSVIDALHQLKRVNELLDALSLSSKEFRDVLREKAMPVIMQHGISSLPDEILAQVFESVHQDAFGQLLGETDSRENERNAYQNAYKQIRRISNVCQRFRRIALNTPLLWSTLHCNMHPETLQSFLRRSKTVPLSLIIEAPLTATRIGRHRRELRFLLDVLDHSHRWQSVVLDITCDTRLVWEILQVWFDEVSELRDLELPSLTNLSIRTVGSRSSDSVTIDDARDFFSQWKTPRLRSLRLYSVIPSRVHNYGDTVRSLTFSFGDIDVSLRYFFSFLSTLPNLEEFTLVGVLPTALLQTVEAYEHGVEQGLCLSRLTSLTLRRCDNATLKFVLICFLLPKLCTLALVMDLSSYSGGSGSTLHSLPFLNILYDHAQPSFLSQITSLSLSIDRSRIDVHPHTALDHLFTNFTNLEHFSLSSHPEQPYVMTGKMLERVMFHSLRGKYLKTIRVVDCCTDLVAGLPRTLHYVVKSKSGDSRGEESRFERLEIVGRTNFVEEDFKSLPKEKVVWVPQE